MFIILVTFLYVNYLFLSRDIKNTEKLYIYIYVYMYM